MSDLYFPEEDSSHGQVLDSIAYLEISPFSYSSNPTKRFKPDKGDDPKVFLPAPDVLIDSNNQVYQAAPTQTNPIIKSSDEWKNIAVNTGAELGGAAIGAIAGQALIPIPGVGAFVGGVVGGVLTSLIVSEETSRLAENLMNSTGSMAINDLDNVFGAQAMKSYSFSWNLVPRNEEESKVIQQICYVLRNYSYPTTALSTDTRYYMEQMIHPHLFNLKLRDSITGDDVTMMRSFFFDTRPCVLNSVNIQTSVDRFRVTDNGYPPIVRLDLVFSELEPAFARHDKMTGSLVSRSEVRFGQKPAWDAGNETIL